MKDLAKETKSVADEIQGKLGNMILEAKCRKYLKKYKCRFVED